MGTATPSHSIPAAPLRFCSRQISQKGFLYFKGILCRTQANVKSGNWMWNTSPLPSLLPSPLTRYWVLQSWTCTAVKFTQNYTQTWNSKKAIITNSSPKAAISTFHPTQPQSQPYPYTPPFSKFSLFNTIKWSPVKKFIFF